MTELIPMSYEAKRAIPIESAAVLISLAMATFLSQVWPWILIVLMCSLAIGLHLGVEGARCGWWKGCRPMEDKS